MKKEEVVAHASPFHLRQILDENSSPHSQLSWRAAITLKWPFLAFS